MTLPTIENYERFVRRNPGYRLGVFPDGGLRALVVMTPEPCDCVDTGHMPLVAFPAAYTFVEGLRKHLPLRHRAYRLGLDEARYRGLLS